MQDILNMTLHVFAHKIKKLYFLFTISTTHYTHTQFIHYNTKLENTMQTFQINNINPSKERRT